MVIKRITAAIIMVVLLIFALSACQSADSSKAAAENGIMELSGRDFSRQGNISLDGSWAFYWDRLLPPGEFSGAEPTGYCAVPSYWTNYKGQNLPSAGRATYRLVVKTDGAARLYGIRMPEVYTEYALWINGALIDACGSFASQEAVYLHPHVYDFYSGAPEMEIVLQVKNEAHVYGGVGQSIRLGTPEQIHSEQNFSAAADLFLITICLFAGFYYLILYLFRKRNRELVWFVTLCVSVALRSLFSNTTWMMQFFPGIPFWLGSKIVTLTIPAIIISMLLYTKRLFKDEMPVPAFNAVFAFNLVYALLVLIAPSGIYSAAFAPYLLTVGAACALGIHVSVKAVLHRKKEAVFFLTGMLLLSVGALLDALSYLQVIAISYMLSVALVGFILLQVIMLAKRYSEAFRHAERLSDDLQASLDKVANTETAYMSAQMKPHFLYNALTAIAEKCETDPEEAGRLILSLSKYLRQTLDYDNLSGIVPLKKELELVRAYTSIEQARFANIEVIFDLPDPLPLLQLPPMTLQPLVENAIRHGLRRKRDGGRVIVSVKPQENSVLFSVEDNGVGIPDDVLTKLAVLPNGSVSIGLYNINTRLMRLYGKGLSVKSESGADTSVSFEIPLREEG